ncbi:hypothetical protein FAVG1_10240 [Fusarium avenaceum]|nr:hypothetical protein FAVG1_10240 [Fusarium avenaceum]
MRCHAAHFTLACIAWLFLGFHQFAYCADPDNVLAHARERIWLWEMYNIFCDIEGADKQDVIMPQTKHPFHYYHHISLENKVDGRLTYAEFMSDLQMKLLPGKVDNSLVAPGGDGFKGPTVAEAVDALKKNGWAMGMNVLLVTSGRSNDYTELIGRVNKKFQDYFDKLGDDPKWKRKLIEANSRTHQLSRDIVALRQQEHDRFVLTLLTREKDKEGAKKKGHGLGLTRDELVIEKVPSSVDGGPTHERVDFGQTMMNHPDPDGFLRKLPDGYTLGWQGVATWADELGNALYQEGVPEFTDANKSHHVVKMLWIDMYDKAGKRLGGISPSCRARAV